VSIPVMGFKTCVCSILSDPRCSQGPGSFDTDDPWTILVLYKGLYSKAYNTHTVRILYPFELVEHPFGLVSSNSPS
jgi:hypothetical protein